MNRSERTKDLLDSLRQQRGKVIAEHRRKTGDGTDWKKVFQRMDNEKKKRERSR